MTKKISLFLFLFSLFILFALKSYNETVIILYTSNINAVLEDCGCGGEKLGGLARLKTVIDQYRSDYDNVYLIDTGDSFSSFYYPEKNHFLQQIMKEFKYDFIMKADQEFNSGNRFEEYYFNNKEVFNYYIPENAFEFIQDSLIPENVNYSHISDSPFLVFHGDSAQFRKEQDRFKAKQFVFLSHSQEIVDTNLNQFRLLQSGMDTEFIGVAKFEKNADSYQFISNQFIRLEESISEDPEIKYQVDSFFAHIEDKQKIESTKKKFLYLSAKYCKSCHEPEYNDWLKTNHAHAFETLKNENKAFDLSCIKCHTTGNETGGYKSFIQTADLINVQCESCHQNLPTDHNKASQRLVRTAVGEETCVTCHTPRNSPKFDYNTYLPKIKHWAD